jgi:hypothetical protein
VNFTDPSGFSPLNRRNVVLWAEYHDRDQNLPDTYLDDENIPHHIYMPGNSVQCTIFASMALWEGGLRDKREVSYTEKDGEYRWGREYNLIYKETGGYINHNVVSQNNPWTNTDAFYKFISNNYSNMNIRTLGQFNNISQYFDNSVVYKNSDWEKWITGTSEIQEGDIVFYDKDGGGWDHVALVNNKSATQTLNSINPHGDNMNWYDVGNLPSSIYDYEFCAKVGMNMKPRVIEKSGGVSYEQFAGRSIDNTLSKIQKIEIFHIE